MKFLLQELATVIDGQLYTLQQDGSLSPNSVFPAEQELVFSIDTRTIQPGQLFIALPGQNTDGHAYLNDALKKGALGFILSDLAREVSSFKSQASSFQLQYSPFIIQVTDTLHALHSIARTCRQKHSIPLAGITGSNGKTTVKDMTAAILATRAQVLKSQKSFNNPIGLPLTLANMTERDEVAILEMGMNAPGEILRLAGLARPDVGVITNVAPAHIGFFPSIEAIMQAKLELFEALPPDGIAIVNADDALCDAMLQRVQCDVMVFGAHSAIRDREYPRIFSENLRVSPKAAYAFDLHTPNGSIPIQLPVPGYHNVLNALAATAVVVALQRPDLDAIKEGLEHFQPSPMRMQVITHHDVTILNDAYNANPASMAAAFQTLKLFPCEGKKIAVLGDMLELGDHSPAAHYEIGKLAAGTSVAHLFLLGEYAAYLAQGAEATGMPAAQMFVGETHEQLAAALAMYLQPRDLVLVKASRGMAMEKVIEYYIKMST